MITDKNNFDEFFNSYRDSREQYFRRKDLALNLMQEFKNFSVEEKKYSLSILKSFLEDVDDFYTSLFLIDGLSSLGKISEAKSFYINLVTSLIKEKKYQRVFEVYELTENFQFKNKNEFLLVAKMGVGDLNEITNQKLVLESLNFNDIKLNSSIYFKNTFILKRFVELIEVYSEVEVLETILKAVPIIPIDNHFLKSLEKISYVTGSRDLANTVIKVTESLGQSFGVNIDKLRTVERSNETLLEDKTDVLEYRAPINFEVSENQVTPEREDRYELAKSAEDSQDYLLAIATYREIIFEGNINKETYFKCVSRIAKCYERLGNIPRATKLKEFLRRKKIE